MHQVQNTVWVSASNRKISILSLVGFGCVVDVFVCVCVCVCVYVCVCVCVGVYYMCVFVYFYVCVMYVYLVSGMLHGCVFEWRRCVSSSTPTFLT
jgi:hypothetical protein